MKNKFIITLLLIFLCFTLIYPQDYYWNRGEKVFVKTSGYKNFYLFSEANRTIQNLEVESTKVYNRTLYWTLGNFEDDDSVEYMSPAIIDFEGDTLNFSNLFYVRLKDEKNIEQLEKMANGNNIDILGNNEFMPLWYTLSCSKNSTGNALEMANLFYESKLFSVTEVDFLTHYELHNNNCVNNDVYFNDQWNLKNTGQYGGTPGIDINYCAAKFITEGDPSIIVAVMDSGIEVNHPDFVNIHPDSYDIETGGGRSGI